MRQLISVLAIGLIAAIGCDGENTGPSTSGSAGAPWEQYVLAGGNGPLPSYTVGGQSSTTPVGPSGGATSSSQTGTSTSSSGIPAGCNLPACYANLFSACLPEGTCVAQESETSSKACYSNGVKLSADINTTTMTATMVCKKGGSTIYTLAMDSSNMMTVKDGSAKTVATLESTQSGDTIVTCTGQAPVTLNSACDSAEPGDASASASSCTAGACSP